MTSSKSCAPFAIRASASSSSATSCVRYWSSPIASQLSGSGRVIGETKTEGASQALLAEMMVGRFVDLIVDKTPAHPDETVLVVENLKVLDNRLQLVVNGASLDVHTGEILGIAGVQGNGQTELVEALTGLRIVQEGTVTIDGQDVTNATPRKITESGVSHVPEDRQEDGLVLSFPVHDNFVINTYYRRAFLQRPGRQRKSDTGTGRRPDQGVQHPYSQRRRAGLQPLGRQPAKGHRGAQLNRPIRLLIANQPTRGLDVGSINFIHRRLVEKRDAGVAVLLVSAELDEIIGLSDRIAIMFKGKFTAVVNADDVSKEQLGLMMAGSTLEEALVNAPRPVTKAKSDRHIRDHL